MINCDNQHNGAAWVYRKALALLRQLESLCDIHHSELFRELPSVKNLFVFHG